MTPLDYMESQRATLNRELPEFSPDAVEYVLRQIGYAYWNGIADGLKRMGDAWDRHNATARDERLSRERA